MHPNPKPRGKPKPCFRSPETLPVVSRRLVRLFCWYANRLLRRRFHALRLSHSGINPAAVGPLVVYLNHASWWDPIVCAVLAQRFFPGRPGFAPIEAAALDKYKFFKRLGFFPVSADQHRGAAQFMRATARILSDANHVLWITPQGRFADARERPVEFKRGLRIIANRMPSVHFISLALEYTFWEESRPEILARFSSSGPHHLEQTLMENQDTLAREAIARDPRQFHCVTRGSAGASPVYDAWRAARSWLAGTTFSPEHGTK